MKTALFFIGLLVIISCSQYNETESIQLAAYSLSSYCKQSSLSPFDCGKICERSGSLSDVSFIDNSDSNLFGFIGYQEQKDQILVVFRGSILTNLQNILIDLDIIFTSYEFCQNCSVSGGFYKSYKKLKSQTNELFVKYRQTYPNAKVVVTGHSLGAALATFFAIDVFQTYDYKIESLYTFGSPRIGNEAFAQYYNSIIDPSINFRVVKARDNVARYPFKDVGYRHIGQEIYYDENDNFVYCTSESDSKCDTYYFWQLSFEDHQKYVKVEFKQFRGDPKCTNKSKSFLNQSQIQI